MGELFKKAVKQTQSYIQRLPENKLAKSFIVAEGITEKEMIDYEFLFWHIFWVEKKISSAMAETLKEHAKNPNDLAWDVLVRELDFRGKVSTLKESLPEEYKKKYVPLISYAWKINNLRNQLFHQKSKIGDLAYDGEGVSLRRTKEKMLKDLFDIATPLIDEEEMEKKIKERLEKIKDEKTS